jgi:CheY-like chemotaxis protein
MKILVAWDEPEGAELLHLYLSGGGNEAVLTRTADELLAAARRGGWDVLLMALTFPATAADGFALFCQVRQALPGLPVVLACRPAELLHLPRFLKQGLKFHLSRDNQADFVFLVLATLEAAVAASRAEEAERQHERLKRYLDE